MYPEIVKKSRDWKLGVKNEKLKKPILLAITIYQRIFSPDHGIFRRSHRGCRFYPSCSEYTKQAVEKFGAMKGCFLGARRVLRCHPWSEGGIDTLEI